MGSNSVKDSQRDVFDESIYPLDSRILLVPLNEEESKCWLSYRSEHFSTQISLFGLQEEGFDLGEALIELDHPLVPALSDFVVAAFNELCRMYFNGVDENIYEAEVKKVTYDYIKLQAYIFIITLEAMEEDSVGVYEATVLCEFDDGRRTLLKFIRTTRPPAGRKFKGMSDLIREKTMWEALNDQKKSIENQLMKISTMKGKKRFKGSAEVIRLRKDYKAVKGACRIFNRHIQAAQKDWKIKRSNPDNWRIPDKITGLRPRGAEHLFLGYDYHNPLTG